MNKVLVKIVKAILIFLIILILIVAAISIYFIIINKYKTVYYAEDFGIEVIKSQNDANNNGVDDYTDILLGARQDAENKPKYISKYYAGGYPPENEGVCADVIWRALENAGYDLKSLVDEDIKNNLDEYPRVNGTPDTNIDFRRVPNLKVFFERNSKKLTDDITQIVEFQPR